MNFFVNNHISVALLEAPYVLKADGLCAGKGVLILPTLEEAKKELKEMPVSYTHLDVYHLCMRTAINIDDCRIFLVGVIVYRFYQTIKNINLLTAANPMDAYNMPEITLGTIKAADGKTDLYLSLIHI